MNPALQTIQKQLNSLILGKNSTLDLVLTCVLARGHLLLEDVPGVGKTTLATGLANVLGLSYQRVQFTNDMLPSDLLGVNVFQPQESQFKFHQGPVFNQFLLADEINRASPKVQSALLEAMEEGQVSVDGTTYMLPKPFMVIATQNPTEQLGTFPLPESQLDRFMMRVSLGYPAEQAEKYLYLHGDRRQLLPKLQAALNGEQLQALQQQVQQVQVSEALADYAYRLVQETRKLGLFVLGLSPRSGLAVIAAAKAWAFLQSRQFVIPEDVQAVFPSVANHRLRSLQSNVTVDQLLQKIIQHVVVA
ncbi:MULTISPECIES: AAA family ATPase [Vitreoscilla]|uniref:AAA family ATPase n=1 Tax=Vitreoscilla stercoraria TaxID=61 RepID=A0ABY4EDS3_VITST|nr:MULTISPECIES: AAA family ATPase [Vitreoscilla]AUZ04745.1 ATPase AAA [Vitreoscilla sp. C1]UOO91572.1 AAA family ATPase [Vitreoscilla stercoraria]